MTLLLLYEKQKGRESFWAPYIEVMPEVTFFCDAGDEAVNATQNAAVVRECRGFQSKVKDLWKKISPVLSQHLSVFQPKFRKLRMFYRTYAQVCTRTFGWGRRSLAMVPMAECFNHADSNVVNCQVNTNLQLQNIDAHPDYFSQTKVMGDFSVLFRDVKCQANFDKTAYEAN